MTERESWGCAIFPLLIFIVGATMCQIRPAGYDCAYCDITPTPIVAETKQPVIRINVTGVQTPQIIRPTATPKAPTDGKG